jgi:hypothetical protein
MTKEYDPLESEKQKEDDRKKRESTRKRELNDIRKVLSLPEGRRVIWRILGNCGMFRSPYTPKDTNATFVEIGKKEIGLQVLQDVTDAKPEAYYQMYFESVNEKNEEKKQESGE